MTQPDTIPRVDGGTTLQKYLLSDTNACQQQRTKSKTASSLHRSFTTIAHLLQDEASGGRALRIATRSKVEGVKNLQETFLARGSSPYILYSSPMSRRDSPVLQQFLTYRSPISYISTILPLNLRRPSTCPSIHVRCSSTILRHSSIALYGTLMSHAFLALPALMVKARPSSGSASKPAPRPSFFATKGGRVNTVVGTCGGSESGCHVFSFKEHVNTILRIVSAPHLVMYILLDVIFKQTTLTRVCENVSSKRNIFRKRPRNPLTTYHIVRASTCRNTDGFVVEQDFLSGSNNE